MGLCGDSLRGDMPLKIFSARRVQSVLGKPERTCQLVSYEMRTNLEELSAHAAPVQPVRVRFASEHDPQSRVQRRRRDLHFLVETMNEEIPGSSGEPL